MATVQTNGKLIERTLSKVNWFASQERKRYNEAFQRSLPDTGDDLYQKLVGENYLAWVKQAPKGMLDMVDKLRIVSLGNSEIAMDLTLDKEVAQPAQYMRVVGGFIESGFKCLAVRLSADFSEWQPYMEPADTLHQRRVKLQQDVALLTQFIRRLMNNSVSLGPVLRQWPPMWDLLDEDDRRRQGAKPYGSRLLIPESIATPEQVTQFTAMVVRIKMASR